MNKKIIALLGAGSWGTAVAIHLAHIGHQVLLWSHDPQHVALMEQQRVNPRYLPDVPFPQSLSPVSDFNQCIKKADYVFIAVPSHAFSELIMKMEAPPEGLSWLTKGIDPQSHLLLSDLVSQHFGQALPQAIITGPSFANEVAQGLPTAITLASNNSEFQKNIRNLLHHDNVRVYLSEDLIGVQICGAIKNVLAIGCGLSDGLGYGANAKAALITRGLAEMQRLGRALGARPETFLGLAGVGDLVLTCTDDQSRNRRFGLLLGTNVSINEAEQQIGQVVEGKTNASQVCYLAKQHQVEMPICEQINALIEGKITPKEVAYNLMNRPPRGES
jgi:glycerol-3-phosphate dehydrogenase (NAD(P)+)